MAFCICGVLVDAVAAGLAGAETLALCGLVIVVIAAMSRGTRRRFACSRARVRRMLKKSRLLKITRAGADPLSALVALAGPLVGVAILDVGLQAWLTGRLGWTGVAVATVAITVQLTDPDRPYVRHLVLAAGVFAAAAVLMASMFSGGNDARVLTIAVAGVIMPVVLSDRVLGLLKLADSAPRQRIMLILCTVLFAGLGWARVSWAPGVLHECFTPPSSAGATALRASGDGQHCYGLIDTDDPGVFARTAFGQNEVTRNLELAALRNNRPVRDDDLTVVWMGTLSCKPNPADFSGCVDGIDYPNERDQLRALLLAQAGAEAEHEPRLHVVIADILPEVAYADAVAELVVEHRGALGRRLVVMGGTDSRDQTERAINRLLDAGIPFIAPSLLGDLDAPGRPFVDRPGYFQLSSPNRIYAQDLMSRLRRLYRHGVDLTVYQLPNASDQYTTSLVNDVIAEANRAGPAKASGWRVTPRHVTSPDQLDRSICKPARGARPVALFFADRWTTFAEFLGRVDALCGSAGPQQVFADGSASRFMANYHLRATSTVAWPLDYYVPGPGCPSSSRTGDIVARINRLPDPVGRLFGKQPGARFACRTAKDRPMCTLDVAAVRAGTPCAVNELGTSLLPAWDAVMLAEKVVTTGTDDLSTLHTGGTLELTDGTRLSVVGGCLQAQTVKIDMWRADAVADPTHTWPTSIKADPAAPSGSPKAPETGGCGSKPAE